jgi:hypothetical protein
MAEKLTKAATSAYDGSAAVPLAIGRPRKNAPAYTAWSLREDPPANIQEFIRERAAAGDTLVLIAHALKTSDTTLRRWMREDENLAWAYRVGTAQDEAKWVGYLRRDAEDAEKPNTNALAYLNRRHQWRRDNGTGEGGAGSGVTIILQQPMSPEDYRKSFELPKLAGERSGIVIEGEPR